MTTSSTPVVRPALRHRTSVSPSRVPKIVGLVALAMVLSLVTYAATVYQGFADRLESKSSDITDLLGPSRPDPVEGEEERLPTDSWEGRPLNILVLGSDARDDDNAAYGFAEGMRSDTTMIVHVAADRSRVDIVSIPRDLIVEIPQCRLPDGGFTYFRPLGTDEFNGARFNEAFALGSGGTDVRYGAACTILTIENMTDIFIDDWAVIDMTGFKDMVDAIGGVKMCIEEEIDNRWADLKLDAGCQTLDGDEALGFARARKGIGDGSDIGRIGRQQELMHAMADQTLSAGVLANPSKLVPLLDSAAASLHTSTRLGRLSNLTGLAYSLRNLDTDSINFITPPLGYTGNVVVQTWEMQELWEALREDLPVPVEDEDDADSQQDDLMDDGAEPATR